METSANNKRIAKNTLILYFRMLFSMLVSLYTSRVILQVLGVEDYGIYNIVGGFVAMFSLLSSSLSVSIQRFLTYELGQNNINRLSNVFSTSINLLIILSVIIGLIAETLGLWFVNQKLNYPEYRVGAVNWVYQISIITFIINLLSIPYNAIIAAHEQFKAYSYISILEVLLKFIVVIMLKYVPYDKLIIYALFILVVAIIIRVIYVYYVRVHFDECVVRFKIDRSITTEMFSFTAWNFLGTIAWFGKKNVLDIFFNIYYGVTLNAARAIANQVANAVLILVNGFTTAVNPQITKSFSIGNIDAQNNIVFRASKFSYYLLFVLAVPIFVNIDFLLNLWLGIIPEYTVSFSRIEIIIALIDSISMPLITLVLATGKVRNYQLIISGTSILMLPINFLMLYYGYAPVCVLSVNVFFSVIAFILRLFVLKKQAQFPVVVFFKEVIIPILKVSIMTVIIVYVINLMLGGASLTIDIARTILCFLISVIIIALLGLKKSEYNFIFKFLYKR